MRVTVDLTNGDGVTGLYRIIIYTIFTTYHFQCYFWPLVNGGSISATLRPLFDGWGGGTGAA